MKCSPSSAMKRGTHRKEKYNLIGDKFTHQDCEYEFVDYGKNDDKRWIKIAVTARRGDDMIPAALVVIVSALPNAPIEYVLIPYQDATTLDVPGHGFEEITQTAEQFGTMLPAVSAQLNDMLEEIDTDRSVASRLWNDMKPSS